MNHLNLFFIFIVFSLTSCGTITSTGTRYHHDKNSDEGKEKEVKKADTVIVKGDLETAHNMPGLETVDTSQQVNDETSSNLDVWYSYDTTNNNSGIGIPTKQIAGYRVLILTTDDLDEANKMKTEIYFKTDRKPVYISFDPPFYKVKAGDFFNPSEAKEFGFKLNQMGYQESKVVRDTINIFH
jgi:hypothetical protein